MQQNMTFTRRANIWWTNFQTKDISFGIHICWQGRVDIHFLCGMLSMGNVPIYTDKQGRQFAVSNSFHTNKAKPIRTGTP
jgi:hypothetical protein